VKPQANEIFLFPSIVPFEVSQFLFLLYRDSTTGWMIRGSNSGRKEKFFPSPKCPNVQICTGFHPTFSSMVCMVLSRGGGGKEGLRGRRVKFVGHLRLLPKKGYSYTSMSLIQLHDMDRNKCQYWFVSACWKSHIKIF
jgi:hypothetical protein